MTTEIVSNSWALVQDAIITNMVLWDGNGDANNHGWYVPEGTTMVPFDDTIHFDMGWGYADYCFIDPETGDKTPNPLATIDTVIIGPYGSPWTPPVVEEPAPDPEGE